MFADSLRLVVAEFGQEVGEDLGAEGHVPEDMEEEPDLTTKDILSYSWRGLKEAR